MLLAGCDSSAEASLETRMPSAHDEYCAASQKFWNFVDARGPGTFIIEEVEGLEDVDPVDDRSYLCKFFEMATDRGFHVRAFKLRAGDWIAMRRNMIYVVGVRQEHGGQWSADWIHAAVEERFGWSSQFRDCSFSL